MPDQSSTPESRRRLQDLFPGPGSTVYHVTSPSGQTWAVPGPPDLSDEDIVARAQEMEKMQQGEGYWPDQASRFGMALFGALAGGGAGGAAAGGLRALPRLLPALGRAGGVGAVRAMSTPPADSSRLQEGAIGTAEGLGAEGAGAALSAGAHALPYIGRILRATGNRLGGLSATKGAAAMEEPALVETAPGGGLGYLLRGNKNVDDQIITRVSRDPNWMAKDRLAWDTRTSSTPGQVLAQRLRAPAQAAADAATQTEPGNMLETALGFNLAQRLKALLMPRSAMDMSRTPR